MAACKIIPIYSVSGVCNVERYLRNESHPHHLDFKLEPIMRDFTCAPEGDFIGNVDLGFELLRNRVRPGRSPVIVAQWQIITFAPDSWLDEGERDIARREIHSAVTRGEESESSWHHNLLDGSADWNRLSGAFAGPPQHPLSRRIRHVNEWSQLCQVADAVTDELNSKRAAVKRPLIRTMQEAIADLAHECGFPDFFSELAALKKPLKSRNLKEALVSIGHEVTHWDLGRDKVVIRRKGRRRPTRLSISGTLAAVHLLKQKSKLLGEQEQE